ncbi:MAG TPA: LacI family DNA-binding transcriptional regulator [Candidatus Anaerobutyricum avicola]|nr:LacI family DNA-binding transcriptional regulator [Candidatus Anaerobutyricum avicola]
MATLKDVAREAGLTVTTVSRVLNNRGYISDNARRRVAEAMKKLNYRPNELARSLQNKNSNMIGVIVPHIRHPYFAEMISNLENESHKRGYKMLLCNSQGRDEKTLEYVEMCYSNRVAGVILCSGTVDASTFERLDIPIITVERYVDTATASVECDNIQGGALAAKKLISSGCKHLLHIGSFTDTPMSADRRVVGFRQMCAEYGIPFLERLTEVEQFDALNYSEMVEEVFREHPDIDGLFGNSDVIAAQAIQVCRKLGLSVPEQVKIIGFDDSMIAPITAPQLTTIHQPIKEMATMAVDFLDKAVVGQIVPKRTVLPVHLVEREST